MHSIRQFANSHADVIAVAVLLAIMVLHPQVIAVRNASLAGLSEIQPLLENAVAVSPDCGEDSGFRSPICPELSPFAMSDVAEARQAVTKARRQMVLTVRQLPLQFQ